MNMTRTLRLTTLTALAIALGAPSSSGQGSLTPTGGPMPMMRTLSQIEPRTPISALPFVINEPGSYYVTGPLQSTNGGIRVSASDVTIDLMGFTLSGPQATNVHGIHVAGGNDVMLRNVVIRNGGLTRFGTGVLVENAQGGQIRDLLVHQNTAHGIVLRENSPGTCSDFAVSHCTVSDNGGYGIYLDGNGNHRNRSHTIRENNISGNFTYGLRSRFTHGSLIEGNLFGPQVPATNAYAISSGTSRNLVLRNHSYGNTNEIGTAFFFISTSDTFGPIITAAGQLSVTNSAVSPWANFSR